MTTHRARLGAFAFLVLMCLFAWYSVQALAQTRGEPERFDASYADLNSGRTGPVQISVTRWSTPAERTALQQTLFKKGQDALLETLRDMRPVGRINTPGSIGYDVRYAEERKLPDGGREIILATDKSSVSSRQSVVSVISRESQFISRESQFISPGDSDSRLMTETDDRRLSD